MLMYRKIMILILISLLLSSIAPVSFAQKDEQKELDPFVVQKADNRTIILSRYLATHNSPLQYHAQDFIDAADKNSLDWKLVPAIAGVESTFGKFIPGGYNGWGWGVYGNQALYFKSWKDGIYTVSAGLKKNYIDRGLKDPLSINRVYAASPSWGRKVNFFIAEITKFEKENPVRPEIPLVNYSNLEDKTSKTSAQLVVQST